MLASCGDSSGRRLTHSFSSTPEGVSVRYPDGWSLTTVNHDYVPDPALCFDVSNVTAQTIVDLKVVEYLPPYFDPKYLSTYKQRPNHFDLDAFRKGDEDWSTGRIQSFRDQGRVFFAGLVLTPHVTRSIRREVTGILDSLTISPQGRCRPTSGVGSHGVPAPTRSPVAQTRRSRHISSVAGFQTTRSFELGRGRAVRNVCPPRTKRGDPAQPCDSTSRCSRRRRRTYPARRRRARHHPRKPNRSIAFLPQNE